MKKNELIISLIKDDLINSKLVNGLNELGLEAGNYFLYLSETIFSLMEINLDYGKKAKKLDVKNQGKAFNKLAEEIYISLKTFKKVHCKKEKPIQKVGE